MASDVLDLHAHRLPREALLRVNNTSARETSLLSPERFDQMIGAARVATFIEPQAAFLLAFEQSDDYDGLHFQWFRDRYEKFLYVDRVVVAEEYRRYGLGRMLYSDLFARLPALGHTIVVCEVNVDPPNPVSDSFHDSQRFTEVGRATIDNGAKIVRYLLRRHMDIRAALYGMACVFVAVRGYSGSGFSLLAITSLSLAMPPVETIPPIFMMEVATSMTGVSGFWRVGGSATGEPLSSS